MPPRRTDDRVLIVDLLERLGTPALFVAGAHVVGTLRADGLALRITAEVIRDASGNDVARYQAAALETLSPSNAGASWDGKWPYVALHCAATTRSRGRWPGRGGGACERPIVAAVVTRGTSDEAPPRFHFVCGVHRDHHRVDPANVLAIVTLPAGKVLELRKLALAETARRERAAAEADRARERSVECPVCKAPPGEPCVWPGAYTRGVASHAKRRELAGL